MWGIMNILLGGVGGTGGGVFAQISSWSPALVYFAVLAGIAFGLFISNQMAAKKIQKRQTVKVIPSQITNQEQKYADWMTAAINRDVGDFQRYIRVDPKPHIEWGGAS